MAWFWRVAPHYFLLVVLVFIITWGILNTTRLNRHLHTAIFIAVFAVFVALPVEFAAYGMANSSFSYRPEPWNPLVWREGYRDWGLISPVEGLPSWDRWRSALLWRDGQGRLLHCWQGKAEPVASYDVEMVEYSRGWQSFVETLMDDEPFFQKIITVRLSFVDGREEVFRVERAHQGVLLGRFPWGMGQWGPDHFRGPEGKEAKPGELGYRCRQPEQAPIGIFPTPPITPFPQK